MYNFILILHNWWRWVVVVVGVLAIVTSWIGWLRNHKFEKRDRQLGMFFGVALDIQLLLGLILYFISPVDGFVSLKNLSTDDARFFGFEHILYMIVAVVCVHVGSVLARRAATDQGKFRRAALWFTASMAIILIGIPWWRPLLRL
jgi:hypothetical protein